MTKQEEGGNSRFLDLRRSADADDAALGMTEQVDWD